MNVVIFRDQKEKKESAKELAPLKVFFCPAIEILPQKHRMPDKEYDFILVTSANALKYAERMPRGKNWVIIGQKTAKKLKISGSRVQVLERSTSEGVLDYFRQARKVRKDMRSILFPRSGIADRELVKELKALGYTVTVVKTYTTKILNIRKLLLKYFRNARISALFLTSPSVVKSLKKSFTPHEMQQWAMRIIAIGPTTRKAWNKLGVGQAEIALQPTLSGLKAKALESHFQ